RPLRARSIMRSAYGNSVCPAAVSSTRRLLRTNSGLPTSSSSTRIRTDTVDCTRCRVSAVREKLPVLARVKNASSWLNSTPLRIIDFLHESHQNDSFYKYSQSSQSNQTMLRRAWAAAPREIRLLLSTSFLMSLGFYSLIPYLTLY